MESLKALLIIEKFIDSGEVTMRQEDDHLRLKSENKALLESIRANLLQIFQKEDNIYIISEIKGISGVGYWIFISPKSS